MDIKKLVMISLAAGSLTLFTACGDDGDNGPADGCPSEAPACDLAADIQPTATCLADASEEATQKFRVTNINIPSVTAGVGFNLDCFNTTATDEFGCGKPDRGDGVDNALASLNQLLNVAVSINLNEQISEGIGDGYTGTIRFNVVLTGWDGTADDDCVIVELESFNPETELFESAASQVAAVVEGGVLKALVDALPLVIPFSDDMGSAVILAVNVQNARIELPIDESGITGGVIGGHVVWDDGSTDDLSSLVESVIASLGEGASISFDDAALIIVEQLDMYVDGVSDGPCDCEAISVGIEIDGEPEVAPDPV